MMSTMGDESPFLGKKVKMSKMSKRKNYFFNSYFRHISLCIHSNFNREHSLDGEFNSASNEYAQGIRLTNLDARKMRNTWNNVMIMSSSHFFMYFSFFGHQGLPKVCIVGTRWMWNWIPRPTSAPDRNLSEYTGRYVENTSWKYSFFFFSPNFDEVHANIILLFPLFFYTFP